MACNGDWLVMGCEAGVAWAKLGQELMQLNTEDVMQVGFSEHTFDILAHLVKDRIILIIRAENRWS